MVFGCKGKNSWTTKGGGWGGKGSWGAKGSWGVKASWGANAGKSSTGWGSKGVHKGVQKGCLKNSSKAGSSSLPANFAVNTTETYTGKVETYWKLKGYGFIILDKKGVLPGDKVFVHWKSIQSEDRFPMLTQELMVQFTLSKETKQGQTSVEATNVCLPGGGSVVLQDDADSKKHFVGGQHLRYTGTLKFFIPQRGYGYITIDDGFTFDGEIVPQEIRAEKAELNAGGGNPAYMKEVQVEFGIWKTLKGAYKAYNVTASGGQALPAEEQ
eukprot:TRINITY_DN76232_c0_g1_i1.p1 TRINITY_DN76232_c0_g1~~TRINITY_DN76232_c0_g1_i1.p1  ORF type:complete len:269 (-),score=51.18 TRINITY_DN76232_c0_g1_i1:62-868(-)